jgi:hypothetical protein
LRIILDVQLTPDGHIAGAIQADQLSAGKPFHGVIELVGLLEECLDGSAGDDRQAGTSPAN